MSIESCINCYMSIHRCYVLTVFEIVQISMSQKQSE